jgi:hypothetical protein
MRKLVLTIALLGSAVAATPALAQDYRGQPGYQQGSDYSRSDGRDFGRNRGYRDDRGYNDSAQQLRQIGFRIERDARSGLLTGREAFALRREYANLVSLDRKLRIGYASRPERDLLDRRIAMLTRQLQQYRNADYTDRGYGDRYRDDRRPGQYDYRN